MVKNKQLWLLGAQSAASYAYTDAALVSLAGANVIEPTADSDLKLERGIEQQDLVAGGFDQDAAVPGKKEASFTLKFPMNPNSVAQSSPPYWASAIAAMCGFSMSAGSSSIALGPVSTPITAGELWRYSGDLAASSCLAEAIYNCMANWKITLEAGKMPLVEIQGKAAYYSIPQDTTQPSITKRRVAPVAFIGGTISFAGHAYKILKLDIDGGQEISVGDDPSQANGIGFTDIVNRRVKFTGKVYATKAATLDPQTAIEASTEAATSIQWGATNSRIVITGSHTQITKADLTDQNGIQTWDIEGQFNRNNIGIAIN